MKLARLVLVALAFVLVTPTALAAPKMRVGSKRFTESYILAEIVVALAKAEGIEAVHEQGLGGTAVTERALEDGAIDVYPEYTGTIAETIVPHRGDVKDAAAGDLEKLRAALAPKNIGISEPLGFQNTYALAASRQAATQTNLKHMSDLAAHSDLRFGLSHEFAGRSDGWPGLARAYGLADRTPTAIDHALAYEALVKGSIDVTDVYTTDAKIARYDLVVLDDDRHYFPPYEAVLMHRMDALTRFPALAKILARLRGAIDAETMRKLNARAELDNAPFPRVAAEYLGHDITHMSARTSFTSGMLESIERHGPRHLELVLGALFLSTLLGVPLGILAYTRRRLGAVVLGITGVVQTIPSLALFCFFIPVLGIGPIPALAALFLYGLLPIVRNTHAGLSSIPSELRDAALALGLSGGERMRHVELPLASRTILAGIKTSAVVAVGSATIAAFIGAGGFGDPISTGLSLNDVPTILYGALPAAGLALVVQGAFALIERALVPKGLLVER
jgi:osmoprotectant transport system permease protein